MGVLRVLSSNLVRLGGIAAVVAGLVFMVLVLIGPQGPVSPSFLADTLSTVLLIAALLGRSIHESADPTLVEDLQAKLEALKSCSEEGCREAEDTL